MNKKISEYSIDELINNNNDLHIAVSVLIEGCLNNGLIKNNKYKFAINRWDLLRRESATKHQPTTTNMAKFEITEVPGTTEIIIDIDVDIGDFRLVFQPHELLDLKTAIKAFFKTKKKEKINSQAGHHGKIFPSITGKEKKKKFPHSAKACMDEIKKQERDSVCEKCKDTGFTRSMFSEIRVCTHCSAAKEIMQENGL